MLRKIIVTVLGHIDTGKTSLLDFIRESSVVKREAGKITQHVGATNVPLEAVERIAGPLLKQLKSKIKLPGLLMIDTPGHASFISLRKRGGSLADLAILVVDINEGIKEQTLECIGILKQFKTPFVIAVNKIDLLPGWQSHANEFFLRNIEMQSESIRNLIDKKLYELVGRLYELGFNAERFDRVNDYTKQVALIPVSAKTGEGLPELLVTLVGLAQRFLEERLRIEIKGYAKGTVLEVKEDVGLGTTVDAIIYDGTLKKNDMIVIGGLDKAIFTKVRALFEPAPLAEIRDKKSKFISVEKVVAAAGVKISAPDLNEVIAGMPIRSCKKEDVEMIKKEIQEEVREVLIETDKSGVVVKADTLGSLEAMIKLLKENGIKIKRASIGDINKKDLTDAESEKDPFSRIILGFNVRKVLGGNVKIIVNEVIYKIIEDFKEWQEEERKREERKILEKLVRPVKLRIMGGYIFRQSNPAVVGVEVLGGVLKTNTPLMKKGEGICVVKSIQLEGESINEIGVGKEVAVSLPGVVIGRRVKEEDILYSDVSEEDFRTLRKHKKYLNKDEIVVLKEISAIKRKENPMWGV